MVGSKLTQNHRADVAGRVYPNLDEHPAVAHLTAEEHRVRVLRGMAKPNGKVMALAPAHKWRGELGGCSLL